MVTYSFRPSKIICNYFLSLQWPRSGKTVSVDVYFYQTGKIREIVLNYVFIPTQVQFWFWYGKKWRQNVENTAKIKESYLSWLGYGNPVIIFCYLPKIYDHSHSKRKEFFQWNWCEQQNDINIFLKVMSHHFSLGVNVAWRKEESCIYFLLFTNE